MHWLGKSYKVWFEKPDGEVVPLIDIPHWDFHWQKYYTFQYVQPIPAGSVLKSEGVYDNTLNNHDNPNNPPITVSKGVTTDDEMFLCYFIFAEYENGDENILLDSTLVTTNTQEVNLSKDWRLFPNPSSHKIHLEGNLSSNPTTYFRIINHLGISVQYTTQNTGFDHSNITFDVATFPAGVYWIEWKEDAEIRSSKFVKF